MPIDQEPEENGKKKIAFDLDSNTFDLHDYQKETINNLNPELSELQAETRPQRVADNVNPLQRREFPQNDMRNIMEFYKLTQGHNIQEGMYRGIFDDIDYAQAADRIFGRIKKRVKLNNPYQTKINHQIFKSSPSWNRLFNHMISMTPNVVNYPYWQESIELIKNNMDILKRYINAKEYMDVAAYKHEIDEDFVINLYEDAKEAIAEHKVDRFIKKNFAKDFADLITPKNEDIIKDFFKNDISEKLLRTEITSRIHTIKDSNDLNERLKSTFSKGINWNKSYYLSKIKKNNIEIMKEDENLIIIKIKEYKEVLMFAPNSWCIKSSLDSFNEYVYDNRIQLIKFNFNYYANDNKSIIGVTLDLDGKILEAQDYENKEVTMDDELKKEYSCFKISDNDYIQKLSNENKDINKSLFNIVSKRPHLLKLFLKKNKKQINKIKINYINESNDAYGLKKSVKFENENYFKKMALMLINSQSQSKYIFKMEVLPYLLIGKDFSNILLFLDNIKERVDLSRLAFSTNYNYVSKEMQEVVFSWIKRRLNK